MTSGSVTTAEFAALAAHAYSDASKDDRVFRWKRQNFLGDPTNGFFASAYHSIKSKQLVIAFRGSGGDLGDWGLTGNLGNALGIANTAPNWNSQLNTAFSYFDACCALYGPSTVAVCGHSLGGFLAAMVAIKRSVLGVTFDRPPLFLSTVGVLLSKSGKDLGKLRLVNFRGAGDPVSSRQDIFGSWTTLKLNVISNTLSGRGRSTLTHSMDELYEAILQHKNSDKPPENWT